MKTLKEITQHRHTVKAYDTTKTVSDADWKEIIDFTHNSPSSMNHQTTRLISVDRGTDLMAKLATDEVMLANARVGKEFAKMVIFVGPGKNYKFDAQDKMVREGVKYGSFQRAKSVAEVTEADINEAAPKVLQFVDMMEFNAAPEWAARQAYIQLGYFTVAAAALGLDTTSMEGFVPSKFNSILRSEGLITEDEQVIVLAGLGYRKDDSSFNKSERKPLSQYLTEVK